MSTPPDAPIFHLLAGPNGAGKSTLYRALVAQQHLPAALEFVNADLYEAAHLQHIKAPLKRSQAARAWADERRSALLAAGGSFVSETVFSHPSKIALIEQAKQAGFAVVLYVVCVEQPQQLLRRVSQRVDEGGHPVAPDKILARYPRTLDNLRLALPLADMAFLFDGKDAAHGGPKLIAVTEHGQVEVLVARLPKWARRVLGEAKH